MASAARLFAHKFARSLRTSLRPRFHRRAATLHEHEGDGPVRVDSLDEFQQHWQRNAAVTGQEPPEVREQNVRKTVLVEVAAAVAGVFF